MLVIVARVASTPPVPRSACHVAQRVERAIDAGALSYQMPNTLIHRGAGKQADLLAAPHRGGGESSFSPG